MDIDLEEARRLGEAAKWTLERVVRELDTLDLLDRGIPEGLGADRARSTRRLLEVIDDSTCSPRRAFAAGVLLLGLHEPEGTRGIGIALRRADDALAHRIANHLRVVDWTLPIRGDEVVEALEPFLRDRTSQAHALAISACSRFGWPAAEPFFTEMLGDPDVARRAESVAYFGMRGLEPRAIEVARSILLSREPEDVEHAYGVAGAVERYLEGGAPELRARASAVLREFVLDARDDVGARGNAAWSVLKGVADALGEDAVPFLSELARTAHSRASCGGALRALVSIAPAVASRLARERMGADLPEAFEVLAKTEAGSRDELLSMRIVRAVGEDASGEVVKAAVDALIAIDAPSAEPHVRTLAAKLDLHDALKARWKLERITPASALECMRSVGVLEDEQIRALPAEVGEQREVEPLSWFLDVFASLGRATWLWNEIYERPWSFEESVSTLAAITAGLLEPEHVSQQWDGDDGYVVRFVCRDRVYAAEGLEHEMPWRIVARLNEALSDTGEPRRLTEIDVPSGLFFVFADPDKLRRAATRLGISMPQQG